MYVSVAKIRCQQVFCLFLLCYILQKVDLLDYNTEHVKIVLHVKSIVLF